MAEDKQHLMVDDHREDAYKVVISVSMVFSVSALLTLCLVVPSMYSYVHNVAQYTKTDMHFCDGATSDIELEIDDTKAWMHKTNRTKRQAYGGGGGGGGEFQIQPGPVTMFAGNIGFQECPACCKPGARGPKGDPGLPGMHGSPGPDGAPGRPGTTPNASCIPERIFEPPPCLPCPQGPRGPPGHPGFPGEPGDIGIAGQPGRNGDPGARGEKGPPGPDGDRGEPGPPGDKGFTPEATVIPGPPGEPGDPGPWGLPGHPGQAGENGYPGIPGERGWPGPPGPPGDIGPQGPPGPAGEIGPPGTPGTCVCQETEVIVEDILAQEARNGQAGTGFDETYPRDNQGYARLAHLRMPPKVVEFKPQDFYAAVVERSQPEEKTLIDHESVKGSIPREVRIIDSSPDSQTYGRGQ